MLFVKFWKSVKSWQNEFNSNFCSGLRGDVLHPYVCIFSSKILLICFRYYASNLWKKDDSYWMLYTDYKDCDACGFVFEYRDVRNTGCIFTLHSVALKQLRKQTRLELIS